MPSSLLYIDTTEINNDVQLTYQEHKLQELISKQIDLKYGIGDIISIMTLLIALGAIVISLTSVSSQINYAYTTAIVILAACLGYGGYAQYKSTKDRSVLQCEITQTLSAIQLYKQSKIQGDSK